MPTLSFDFFSSKPTNRAAIIFVHGFTGDLRKTWRNIPKILHPDDAKQPSYLDDWDLAGFGYSSTKWFDISGLWSADPALPEIATKLYTQTINSAGKYDRIALVAHSMGGLAVQQAIANHDDLRERVSHVLLFGTPSNGLEKAGAADFWKRQIDNMVAGGPFITALRKAWTDKNLTTGGGFDFLSVAGENDQFVPPESSLRCFPDNSCRTIAGTHTSMLEGDDLKHAEAAQMIIQLISGDAKKPKGARGTAHVAIEKGEFQDIIKNLWPEYLKDHNAAFPAVDDYGAGQLGMALEKVGDTETAIKLLTAHHAKGTDVLGILAGRLKRRWWLKSLQEDLDLALQRYQEGYDKATAATPVDHDQAFYHGINVAYLTMAPPTKNLAKAKEWANKVLEHTRNAIDPKQKQWIAATEADALMIRGDVQPGLERHQQSAAQQLAPWEALSMEEQAMRVADLCGVPDAKIKELGGWYEDRP
ncbi:MAG: alpha/beta hydrolase [Candidatus Korobacteraceae bacterium]